MIVLSIHKNHLCSASVFENGKLVYYNQEERLSKKRKDFGFPFYCIDQIKTKFKKIDRCVVTGYNTEPDSNDIIFKYLIHLGLLDKLQDGYSYEQSHHFSHAAKAYYSSGFKKAIIFVVDGRGSDFDQGYETTSIYKVDKEIQLIHKNLFTDTIDIGQFYSNVSKALGYKQEEGKLMGLAPYGKPNKYIQENIHTNIFWKDASKEFLEYILAHPEDLAYATQDLFEKKYMELIDRFIEPGYDVIMTGGTALNVTNNFKIRKRLPKKYKLFIDPLCGDEGNSIGIGAYYCNTILKQKINHKDISRVYLNPQYKYNYKLKDNELEKTASLQDVVRLLLGKNIVALYQGSAEAGPRALGNRSLLLDPRIKNGKDIMNKVKKRESFRPFACSILKEEASKWFDMNCLKESPHMMYAVDCLKKTKIKSVVHIDNTSRVQTVSKEFNSNLYKLLKIFKKETGVPLLMNTSFNTDGKPIVETPEDAINTLRKSDIKYLYFVDIKKLIVIK